MPCRLPASTCVHGIQTLDQPYLALASLHVAGEGAPLLCPALTVLPCRVAWGDCSPKLVLLCPTCKYSGVQGAVPPRVPLAELWGCTLYTTGPPHNAKALLCHLLPQFPQQSQLPMGQRAEGIPKAESPLGQMRTPHHHPGLQVRAEIH